MTRTRVGLGALGVLGGCYGLWLLITTVPPGSLLVVGIWMAAAVVLHDAIWSPALLALGRLLTRVPSAIRWAVQAGLLVGGCLVVVAVPMIMAQGRQPASTTILIQPVAVNLLVLLGCVVVGMVLAWLLRWAVSHRRAE